MSFVHADPAPGAVMTALPAGRGPERPGMPVCGAPLSSPVPSGVLACPAPMPRPPIQAAAKATPARGRLAALEGVSA